MVLNYKRTSTVTLLCLFPSLFPVLSVLLFSLFLLSSPTLTVPCSLRSLVLSLPPLFSHSHCSLFSPFSCSLSSSSLLPLSLFPVLSVLLFSLFLLSSPTLTVPCSLRSLVRVREEEEREQENGENREQGALRRRGGRERTERPVNLSCSLKNCFSYSSIVHARHVLPPSLPHSLTRSLTPSLAHSLPHSLSPSLAHSLPPPSLPTSLSQTIQ